MGNGEPARVVEHADNQSLSLSVPTLMFLSPMACASSDDYKRFKRNTIAIQLSLSLAP